MSRSPSIIQTRTAVSPKVTVIYSSRAVPAPLAARKPGAVILSLLIGLLHLLVASGVFYAVWWPIDKWMAVTIMMKVPLPIDAIAKMADNSKGERGSGLAWLLLSAELEAHPAADNPDAGDGNVAPDSAARLRYPMPYRGEIAGRTMYYWQALMASVVGLWSMAAGVRFGGTGGRGMRRACAWGAVIATIVLGSWAAFTWQRYGWHFPISAGQTGLAGVGVLFFLLGAAMGFRGRGVEYAASIWLILSAAASVMALTLADRCDALEPAQAATAFKLLVFAVQSAYGWLILTALVLRARAGRPAFVPAR